jgi:hypothetical protein
MAHMPRYLHYGELIANVTIPEDARVYVESDRKKWKADKIILSNIMNIEEHPCWSDINFCLEAVKLHQLSLMFVKKQTREICLNSVMHYADTICDVKNRTDEIKLAALRKDGTVLRFIPNPTEEMKWEAVKQNSLAIDFIKNPTENLIALAYNKI